MAEAKKQKKPNETRTWWTREKVAIALITAAAMVVVAIIGIIPHLAPSSPPPCSIGKSEPCTCERGRTGVQICADDGSRWLPCQCNEMPPAPVIDTASTLTSPVQDTQTSPESPPVTDTDSADTVTVKKSSSKKPLSSQSGKHPTESDTDAVSTTDKFSGQATCKGKRCTLKGYLPKEITNVCLDVSAPEKGEYTSASSCVVISRGGIVTCTRTGKDNLEPLVGDIKWRSPCL